VLQAIVATTSPEIRRANADMMAVQAVEIADALIRILDEVEAG